MEECEIRRSRGNMLLGGCSSAKATLVGLVIGGLIDSESGGSWRWNTAGGLALERL